MSGCLVSLPISLCAALRKCSWFSRKRTRQSACDVGSSALSASSGVDYRHSVTENKPLITRQWDEKLKATLSTFASFGINLKWTFHHKGVAYFRTFPTKSTIEVGELQLCICCPEVCLLSSITE